MRLFILSNVVETFDIFRISSCVPFNSHVMSIRMKLEMHINDAGVLGGPMYWVGDISSISAKIIVSIRHTT